jgi:hypothetical protein
MTGAPSTIKSGTVLCPEKESLRESSVVAKSNLEIQSGCSPQSKPGRGETDKAHSPENIKVTT